MGFLKVLQSWGLCGNPAHPPSDLAPGDFMWAKLQPGKRLGLPAPEAHFHTRASLHHSSSARPCLPALSLYEAHFSLFLIWHIVWPHLSQVISLLSLSLSQNTVLVSLTGTLLPFAFSIFSWGLSWSGGWCQCLPHHCIPWSAWHSAWHQGGVQHRLAFLIQYAKNVTYVCAKIYS